GFLGGRRIIKEKTGRGRSAGGWGHGVPEEMPRQNERSQPRRTHRDFRFAQHGSRAKPLPARRRSLGRKGPVQRRRGGRDPAISSQRGRNRAAKFHHRSPQRPAHSEENSTTPSRDYRVHHRWGCRDGGHHAHGRGTENAHSV